MRIHHLDCGTMCPRANRLSGGTREAPALACCHCLLLETAQGLVLVDTGIGLDDLRDPKGRLGRFFTFMMRPVCNEVLSARRQVEALGFAADDVRHIVATHLDLDHAGGLPDFPRARVHVSSAEHDAAMGKRQVHRGKMRYRPGHFAHGPEFQTYDPGGDSWFGFECVRPLAGLPPEIALVPVPGHSPGSCAVAVDTGAGWLLHCGDAYFRAVELVTPAKCPVGLKIFQRFVAHDNAARLHNQSRLGELARERAGEVRIFCSHDPDELARARTHTASRVSPERMPAA